MAIDALHQVAEALADDAHRGEVAWRRCDVALRTGDFEATQHWAREALALAAGAGDVALRLRAQHRLAAASRSLGDVEGGKAVALAGLTDARTHGLRNMEGLFLNSLCGFAEAEQDLEASVATARQLLALDRALGDRRGEAFTLINLGSAWHALGANADAQAHLEQGLQVARAVGERNPEPYALLALSQCALRMGQAEAAARHARAALDLARGMQAPLVEAHAWCRLGEAARALRNAAQAVAAFEQSRLIASEKGYACEHDAAAGLAECALDDGDAPGALAVLTSALRDLATGGTLDGAEHPLWNLWVCWRALHRAGDARAAAVLGAAREQVQQRAARISDVALRDSFMRIPEHAAILGA